MAEAYECDKCGKLLSKEDVAPDVRVKKGKVEWKVRVYRPLVYVSLGDGRLDLCENCQRGLFLLAVGGGV